MSGGAFEYNQFRINDIIERIEHELEKQGKEIPRYERGFYLDDLTHYPRLEPEIEEEFNKGLNYLKLAFIYAHRIDWLLSGDDGEENFLKRLKNELKEHQKQHIIQIMQSDEESGLYEN